MRQHNPGEPQFGAEHGSGAHNPGEFAFGSAEAAPRLAPLPVEAAPGEAREVLERLVARQGRATNMVRTMAHAPAVLRGYQELARALKKGELSVELREQIALAIAAQTGCEYCQAAHVRAAASAGLTSEEIAAALEGGADAAAAGAALSVAQLAARDPHAVADADVERLRALGFRDGEIAEILAHVALNLFTNIFTIVTRIEVDPAPAPQEGQPA